MANIQNILLIEDSTIQALLIREMLQPYETEFELDWCENLTLGLEHIANPEKNVDVILLDLTLPDSRGLDTFMKVHTSAPEIPVIMLTAVDDETVGVQAMHNGAQDYLVKGQVNSLLLARSIRYAIERKVGEEALRESQKRYKSLFEDSPTPMWEEDFSEVYRAIRQMRTSAITNYFVFFKNHPKIVKELVSKIKVIDINKAVLKLHQAETKEQILDNLNTFLVDKPNRVFALEFALIAEGEQTFELEEEIVTFQNETRYAVLRWAVADGYEETLSRVLISFSDITEHKLADQALRESEFQLKEAQNIALIGSWTYNLQTKLVTWSDELYRIYGVDNKFEAPDYSDHKKLMSSDDWIRLDRLIQKTIETGDSFEIELQIIRPNGEKRVVLSMGRVQSRENNEIKSLVGTTQDITERKKSEKELNIYREYLEEMVKIRTEELENTKRQNELILNAVGEGIFGVDTNGRITFINPAGAKMLGWTIEDILGQKQHQLTNHTKTNGSPYPLEESPIYKAFNQGKSHQVSDEIFWRQEDGSFPVEYICTPIWENNGLVGAVVVFRDITERRLTEEALKNAKEKAEAATRAKSEFLANMSHEIRTPMNSIIGFSDLLYVSVKDEKQRSQVNSIRNSSNNLLNIINDILDLSKIEAGKLRLEYEPVNLHFMVRDVERIFAQKIQEQGIAFRCNIPEDMPETILIDDVRLRQILFNLVGNAVKFTDHGKVELSISKQNVTADNKKMDLIITLQDSGIGIPLEQQQIIFEAFNQQVGQSIKKYGGTGLGLTITKRLVEMMKGNITLTSKPGVGSTFQVIFADVETTNEKAVARIERDFDPFSIVFKKATVLICDDNDCDRKVIVDLLENYPLTLIEAVSGKDAIAKAHQHLPDLIMMDYRMPDINGYDAVMQLKKEKQTASIPVIVFSASPKAIYNEGDANNIFDDFLLKPLNLKLLLESIKKFLPYATLVKAVDLEDTIQQSFQVTDEQKEQLLALVHILENDFKTDYDQVVQNQKVLQIESFGQSLEDLGERNNFDFITKYGQELRVSADTFDIEKMRSILSLYPKLIEKCKALMNTNNGTK
jgi:PAS domain S-box-containing protein